jgi:predicted ATPase
MITAFTVKNFKAIGDEPVRIELKPITLLFGANSAGKSSILHALHYAYEVFNNHNLNVEKITLGENNSLDLKGFKSFVHNNDFNRSVILNFELDFTVDMVESITKKISREEKVGDVNNIIINPKNLLSDADRAYVQVEVSWNTAQQCPYVSRYEVGINGEKIAAISANLGSEIYDTVPVFEKAGASICYFNITHPLFGNFCELNNTSMDLLLMNYIRFIKKEKYCKLEISENNNVNFRLLQDDALPKNWKYLSFFEYLKWSELMYQNSFFAYNDSGDVVEVPAEVQEKSVIEAEKRRGFASDFENLLEILLVTPGKLVTKWLESTHYLGPLREIPSKDFTSVDPKLSHQRWVTGLAAWDRLYRIGRTDLDELAIYKCGGHVPLRGQGNELHIINSWLSNKSLLNTGYQVLIEYYRELSISSTHPLIIALNSGQSPENITKLAEEILGIPEKIRILLRDESRKLNLTPNEIGTGVSQVLPVVVAAVGRYAGLVAIEQPELHIHPAMQVQLGDLFITQAGERERFSGDKKFFLIETHSEHLLLRILRRIRETAAGKSQKLHIPIPRPPMHGTDDPKYSEKELKITSNEVAIYYVESENGITQANRIGLDENGRFTDRWPRGFFEEREKEYFGEQEDLSDELGRLFGE